MAVAKLVLSGTPIVDGFEIPGLEALLDQASIVSLLKIKIILTSICFSST